MISRAPCGVVGLVAVTVLGCGGATELVGAQGAGGRSTGTRVGEKVGFVTPSRVLPDIVSDRGVVSADGRERRVLVDRMRAIDRDDGTLERAAELLPASGRAQSLAMPERLGGGYLFYTASATTPVWRAKTWLGKLTPLITLPFLVSDIIPGFDRLYVRQQSTGQLAALDAAKGTPLPLSPLPPTTGASYGPMVFVDGWQAIVDTDLRGPLATFDAGASWRPLGLPDKPLAVFSAPGVDPRVIVANGHYAIDARGGVTFQANEPSEATDEADREPRAVGPLGRRPLRAAIEDGWPDSATTAVVARGGTLARVSLQSGAVLQSIENAYAEREASCHAVPLGRSAGFVCGEHGGPTVIYELTSPLGMRERLRFARPRFVSASGKGPLVIRGSCGDGGALVGDTRAYCVRSTTGESREFRVRSQGNDLGIERVVALADGRVAVLVPPRSGVPGRLTLLSGTAQTSVPLQLPASPRDAAHEVARGMWLDGFQEDDKGGLGGWVEAGGSVAGIRVALDGKVIAGELREPAEQGAAVLSGRFGVVLGRAGRAAETSDGGFTWKEFDLPERERDKEESASRACGPVGCALAGWLRVGWGDPAVKEDLQPAGTPSPSYAPLVRPNTLAFDCKAGDAVTPPPAAKTAGKMEAVPTRPGPARISAAPPVAIVRGGWQPFRNTAPPALAADEVGLDNGPMASDSIGLRVYAWGKRGADWTRAGRWIIRFDDRFDPAGGVRSSAASASPWADEATASEAIGAGTSFATWAAVLDPSGRSALVSSCARSAAPCALHAVTEGQPVTRIRDAAGRVNVFPRLLPLSAVKSDERWFFLTQTSGAADSVTLWRADLGVARVLATLPRVRGVSAEAPRLVRRANGGGVGILVSSYVDGPVPSFFVLSVEPDSGQIGDAIPLGRRDLGGVAPRRCEGKRDGWLVDTTLSATPAMEVGNGKGTLGNVELRARLDPGAVCVEAMAASFDVTFTKGGEARGTAGKVPREIPLAATERATGRRWGLACGASGPQTSRPAQ